MRYKSNWKVFLATFFSLGMVALLLLGARIATAENGDVDLSIELKAPQHVEPGGAFTLNIVYSNTGTVASPDDTWVKITMPAGTAFVSAVDNLGVALPPQTIDGNTLTWQVGAIQPGVCCQHIWIALQVADDLPEETLLTSQSEIGSSAVENNLDNNIFSVTSAVCDMAGSTKQAQVGQVKPGDVITYTLTIRMTYRHGQTDSNQREMDLTDILPPANLARFLGWTSEITGTYDGEHLHWQGQVRAGEPVMLQYRLGILGDVPPGAFVTNRAQLAWKGGDMELEPVDVVTYLTENDHMFGAQGGQWQHQSGVTLDVLENTVNEMTRFEFHELFDGAPPAETPPGWIFAHRAFELTAFQFGELHRFNRPITITIGYDEKDVQGLDRNTLRLWYRTGPGEPWAMLGEPQKHQNGQVSFTTDHFTEFALFAQGAYKIHLPLVTR